MQSLALAKLVPHTELHGQTLLFFWNRIYSVDFPKCKYHYDYSKWLCACWNEEADHMIEGSRQERWARGHGFSIRLHDCDRLLKTTATQIKLQDGILPKEPFEQGLKQALQVLGIRV